MSRRIRTFAATCGIAAGSPGPFVTTMPSGDQESSSRMFASTGNTRTHAPRCTRLRTWFSFTPVSMSATFGPAPTVRSVDTLASTTSGRCASGVVARAFATASFAISGSSARCGGTWMSAPRSVPDERSRRVNARVSTPAMPGTPFARRYASRSSVPSRQVAFSSRTTSASTHGLRDSAARSNTP